MEIKNIIIGILVVAIAMTSIAYAYKDPIEIDIPNDKKDAIIRVSGESLIEVEPDLAYVYIEIKTEGSILEEVKKKNNKVSEDVMEALEFTYTQDIETDSYYIGENYWEVTSEKKYIITNVLKVTTNNMNWIGKIIDKAVNNGATGVRSISYELSEEREEEIKKEALSKASENAYEKAVAMAEGLGKEIGDLISIEESDFRYFPYGDVVMETAVREFNTEILPQDVEIRASITLVYEVI